MTNNRFVFDTNTLVSAALKNPSVPRIAVTKAVQTGTILQSPDTILELNDVIYRDKFDKYVLPERRLQFIAAVFRAVVVVTPTITITACRDPKDNKFLELAVDGKAEFIVTGDQDLLVLNPFQQIQIISPAAFLETEQKT